MAYEVSDKGHDFIIRDMNPAAERMGKITRQQVFGRRLMETFPVMETGGRSAESLEYWAADNRLCPMIGTRRQVECGGEFKWKTKRS